MAPYSKIVASQADVPVEPVELLPQHPSLMPANIDKIPSVSRILILVRESSSEFLFPVKESDVATTPFARNVPQTYPVTNGSIHFISFFYLKYLLTYDPFYIKRMPIASPSLHLIVPVHWGIYLHYKKKQGPGCKRPFYVCSVGAAVETSGISTVVE